jgi:hypothetical protein
MAQQKYLKAIREGKPPNDCPEPGCSAKAGRMCAVLGGGVGWQHDARFQDAVDRGMADGDE